MAKVFIASYTGGNCICGDRIVKGDEVSYMIDSLVHAECNEDSDYNNSELMESAYSYQGQEWEVGNPRTYG